jgi:hypothetical protein
VTTKKRSNVISLDAKKRRAGPHGMPRRPIENERKDVEEQELELYECQPGAYPYQCRRDDLDSYVEQRSEIDPEFEEYVETAEEKLFWEDET